MFDPLVNRRVNAFNRDQILNYQRTYDDVLVHPLLIVLNDRKYQADLVVTPQNMMVHCEALQKTWKDHDEYCKDIQSAASKKLKFYIRLINDAPRQKQYVPGAIERARNEGWIIEGPVCTPQYHPSCLICKSQKICKYCGLDPQR